MRPTRFCRERRVHVIASIRRRGGNLWRWSGSFKKLRLAGFLARAIGRLITDVAGEMKGMRIGKPELSRWSMTHDHPNRLTRRISRALKSADPAEMLPEMSAWQQEFNRLHFVI